MSVKDHPRLLRAAFERAVEAVQPGNCLPEYLPGPSSGRTYVIAIGKAAAAMAEVAADSLDVAKALVVHPPGHGPSRPLPADYGVIEASHPVPDGRGAHAAQRALRLAGELQSGDRLIALISGGGSALLPAPVDGVTLGEKQALTEALLRSGASIAEINCVRQCLSRIKGGRLAKAAGQAEVLTLALSDIPGDDLSLIASGPTLPSTATLAQARAILTWRGIDAPVSVHKALKDPRNAPVAALPNATATMIAGPGRALAAAAAFFSEQGFTPILLGDAIEGDAYALARQDAELAVYHAGQDRRVALIAGGEATVQLPPEPPRGGRNLEYALSVTVTLDGHPRISALACDTDGIDGSTPVAGAIVGPDTLGALRAAGINPAASLDKHTAYDALRSIGALVETGPTRTNVNDLRLILVEPS